MTMLPAHDAADPTELKARAELIRKDIRTLSAKGPMNPTDPSCPYITTARPDRLGTSSSRSSSGLGVDLENRD